MLQRVLTEVRKTYDRKKKCLPIFLIDEHKLDRGMSYQFFEKAQSKVFKIFQNSLS